MADTYLCPRHGRHAEFQKFNGTLICMAPRVKDGPPCTRPAMPECAACRHPEHPHGKCSTILETAALQEDGSVATTWCSCDVSAATADHEA